MEPAEAERGSERERRSPRSSLAVGERSERPKLSERREASDRSPGSCTVWEFLAGGSGALDFGDDSAMVCGDVLDHEWDLATESDGGMGCRSAGEWLGDLLTVL